MTSWLMQRPDLVHKPTNQTQMISSPIKKLFNNIKCFSKNLGFVGSATLCSKSQGILIHTWQPYIHQHFFPEHKTMGTCSQSPWNPIFSEVVLKRIPPLISIFLSLSPNHQNKRALQGHEEHCQTWQEQKMCQQMILLRGHSYIT